MEYFRKFLILLRKKDHEENNHSFKIKLVGLTILGLSLGVLIDVFIQFGFLLNMIRGIIANLTALVLFSSVYLLYIEYINNKSKKDRYYKPFRKRFSYNQRINLSVLVGGLVFIFIILNGKPGPTYTASAALAISMVGFIAAFVRRDRNEFIKTIYEIPDVRDLEFLSKNKKNKKKDKKKKKEKENKEEMVE